MNTQTTAHLASIRMDTGLTIKQLDDTELLKFYNRARRKILNKMRTLNKKWFYTEWYADTVPEQIEYTLPVYTQETVGSDTIITPKCSEVIQIAIKEEQEGEYIPYEYVTIESRADIETMRRYNERAYTLLDNSIFIFPTAENEIIQGLKIYGIYEPRDITDESIESEILIPSENEELLIEEVKVLVFQSQRLWEERNIAIADAQRYWNEYKENFDRQKGPYKIVEPNYNQFR